MKKRDFLSLADLSLAEARAVLELARTMKSELAYDRAARLRMFPGRACGILMEKASTRTRVSFEVGAAQLGMIPVVLTTQGSQLARGEPVADTARVLSGYVDLLVFRTSTRERLEQMAKHASVPVINALSDDGHPVQVLSDVFTIEEHFKKSISGMRVAWIGDGSSNMARSFVEASKLFAFELRVAGPADYLKADLGGAHFTTDAREALLGADVVCTDVWTSMGQEAENEKRLRDFAGWTLDDDKLAHAKPSAIVLHCLPAHRGEEISASVIESPRSSVWTQAENRLHVQKALMAFLLGWSPS
ncbi:MAG TPA: ornithine carbamoyltransferase [Polyangiaceae bacterium]